MDFDFLNEATEMFLKDNPIIRELSENMDELDEFQIDPDISIDMDMYNEFQSYAQIETEQVGGGKKDDRFYEITKKTKTNCKKFHCESVLYEIQFGNLSARTYEEADNQIKALFQQLSQEFIDQLGEKDQMRIVFFHDDIKYPISISFTNRAELLKMNLLERFQKVVQSNDTLSISSYQAFKAHIVIARLPVGGGRAAKPKTATPESTNDLITLWRNSERGIKVIENNDNLCLLRAVIVAKAYAEKENARHLLLRQNNRLLNKRTRQLAAQINISNQRCGIAELRKAEIFLRDYQITLYRNNETTPIYEGPMNKKFLYITLVGEHYNVITSMPYYFNRSYFCDHCKIGYDHTGDHKCKNTCNQCGRLNCVSKTSLETSQKCKYKY